MKKKTKSRKWNRRNYFQRQKSNRSRVGHPVLVYGESGRLRKYLLFTHTKPPGKEKDFEDLTHSIDPDEKDKISYVYKRFRVSEQSSLQAPIKKYRIHEDDLPIVRKYKK